MDFIVRCYEMNFVFNIIIYNYIYVLFFMINKIKFLFICIMNLFRYFYKLICWFIILINLYCYFCILVDSIFDFDLFMLLESSISVSIELDLGEDIESFVWCGFIFLVYWVYYIIM